MVNLLFYGFHREDNKTKAFSIGRIQSVDVTNIPYTEKYRVEITANGTISMPPVHREHRGSYGRRSYSNSGPKHIYECGYCRREFRRKNRNSILRPHKGKDGYPCSNRRGYYVGYG